MAEKISAPLDLATLAIQSIDLRSMAEELLGSDHAARDGRAARTLAKSEGLTVVLTVVPAGGNVGEHVAPGPVLIVPIIGTVIFSRGRDGQESHPVSVGSGLLVGEGQRHLVRATEDCAFLIAIGFQGPKK